ncbi:BREX protein BrxB domain-containing protein [Ruminiclostridium cellobioparum]|uniref:BREX protein BrxB domain-containing protein n=1 Tax=Ruminiclostridium cellobioparum TaxID=29355 RepID=UPI0028A8618E|nr:BREX protein BrxB domain-containing protein [Ruminiclostridium cellobioparum]
MSIVKGKFDKLIELLNTDTLVWARHSGVPFIICSFDKSTCGSINKVVDDLTKALRNYSVRVINIEEVIFRILEKEELLEPAIAAEKENAFDVVENIKELILEGIRSEFIAVANELGPKGRILVTRLGGMPIYFRFISLLSFLEGKVDIPVVFFYPGTQQKNVSFMLDEFDDSALRALKV